MLKQIKKHIFTLSLSTPILAKARCKHCLKLPEYYYTTANISLYKDIAESKKFIKALERRTQKFLRDFFTDYEPKVFTSASIFSFRINSNIYRPNIHKIFFLEKSNSNSLHDFEEYIICWCGKTRWGLSDNSGKNRIDILSKKTTKKFNHKFIS